jgi:hypothetical protein
MSFTLRDTKPLFKIPASNPSSFEIISCLSARTVKLNIHLLIVDTR